MSRLDHEPEIIQLAQKLGVEGAARVESILQHCRSRIDSWVAEAGGISDIDSLEALVTNRLHTVFEEVRSDEDWTRLTEVYARGKREFVFAALQSKFDDPVRPTYGALVQRRNSGPDDPDRYVAVIDCRGSKLARRFFTRWHEIAHRLTTHADDDDTKLVFRSEHDPVERLMDEIAGHVGFYSPIFDRAYQQASAGNPLLTFDVVQSVIDRAFRTASFQATLIACARRLATPVVYLEAALAYKKEVKRKIAMRTLFDDGPPPGQLRAVKVISNQSAQRERFFIPTNMRVPADSVIHRVFQADPLTDGTDEEDLSHWESQGKQLESRAVIVEARKVPHRVLAIVQPV